MENYEKLSFTLKKMLKRMKIMRLRLEELTKMMNENVNKSFMNSDEYVELRTENECLCTSETYLNVDIKRTIIMLKICLYKRKIKSVLITEPSIDIPLNKTFSNTISETTKIDSVDQNNDFVEMTKVEKEVGRILEHTDNTKEKCTVVFDHNSFVQQNQRKRKNISLIDESPPSKLTKKGTAESTGNKVIDMKKTDQEFTFENADFNGRKESTRPTISKEITHILTFFFLLKAHYKLLASRKVKCKMRNI